MKIISNKRPKNFMVEAYKEEELKDYIPNNAIPKRVTPDGIRNIVRGDTPEHFLHLPYRKSDLYSLLITYKQGSIVVERRLDDVQWGTEDRNIVYYQLTQEETNSFDPTFNKPCYIQVRALLKNGDVITSDMYSVRVLDVLDNKELTK